MESLATTTTIIIIIIIIILMAIIIMVSTGLSFTPEPFIVVVLGINYKI